ncbi:hypothetical protein ACN6LC_000217 [Streptomyces violaceoruber]|uniref:Uncharacterized protein n=4 Tax=Streptomyces TaxID=1883 RepID=A0ACD4WSK3_STRVN|nr:MULTISPECIES: hypothetical protein [Streptomyces]QSJ11330.1 secreted protein [Streptomyces lividans]BDD72262.1 hypothetical protein JCM4020_28820 [Streptomyces coelicolor]AIJ15753.1 secreted protein [Streptomyces lividans TK24]EFD69186.1 secreted protein [Streptomyces lividans TK24]KKD14972.1 hypothetical protein TR66_12945 [Streptomyces sp. WM6391]
MKPTTRRTLAAVVTGVAAAVGVAATPAAAARAVPVPVPLGGAEAALGMELPEVAGELPVPTAGAPEGPRYVEGRLLPERTLPQLPVRAGLPGVDVRQPLPHVLGDDFDHAGVDAPAAGLRTLAPGLSLDAPLTAPNPEALGLPSPKLPEVGVLAPVVQTVPVADLGVGPGL